MRGHWGAVGPESGGPVVVEEPTRKDGVAESGRDGGRKPVACRARCPDGYFPRTDRRRLCAGVGISGHDGIVPEWGSARQYKIRWCQAVIVYKGHMLC